jgi:hypothetical protein
MLALHNREDSQEIFDLADVAKALGCLQATLYFFTIGCRDGKTDAAHRDVPPQ